MTIILILLNHFVADYLLQSEYIATTKSKNNMSLLIHVTLYTLAFVPLTLYLFEPIQSITFLLITFTAHFLTDYITSKWSSKLHKRKQYYGIPGFFPVLGFDQFLHQVQLILCYEYLIE